MISAEGAEYGFVWREFSAGSDWLSFVLMFGSANISVVSFLCSFYMAPRSAGFLRSLGFCHAILIVILKVTPKKLPFLRRILAEATVVKPIDIAVADVTIWLSVGERLACHICNTA